MLLLVLAIIGQSPKVAADAAFLFSRATATAVGPSHDATATGKEAQLKHPPDSGPVGRSKRAAIYQCTVCGWTFDPFDLETPFDNCKAPYHENPVLSGDCCAGVGKIGVPKGDPKQQRKAAYKAAREAAERDGKAVYRSDGKEGCPLPAGLYELIRQDDDVYYREVKPAGVPVPRPDPTVKENLTVEECLT